MLAVLGITFPIFATIALGYLLTRRGLFAPPEMAVFGRFVVNIALPALIFAGVTSRPLTEVFNAGYALSYGLVAVLNGVAGFLVMTLAGWRAEKRAVGLLGMVCANSGYVGYPVMLLAAPDIAGTYLTLNLIVENFFVLPLAILVMELSRSGGRVSPLLLLRVIVMGLLRRPMILFLLIGLGVNLLGVPLPVGVTRLATLFAAASSALALFYIGGSLVGLPLRGNVRLASTVVAMKLFGMPLAALAVLAAGPLLGLPPLGTGLELGLIVTAAVPMLGIYAILAGEHGQEGMASIAQLGATITAFFTLSALLALLHP
ncbi:AEC family transporter [Frigidibacter sp. MR17.14]|uniref:AEC family transporter n=1 Tax=Frigidibacter sp. MR17.14 TaxID=3126509 RepID=UPI003012A4D3